jgi:hypothetical protein
MYLEPFKLKVNNFEEIDVYLDDTISMIKQKIYSIENKGSKIYSLYEMYLCIEIREQLNVESIYKTLSRNEQIKITTRSLRSFCNNIKEKIVFNKYAEDNEDVEEIEYTLTDLRNIFNQPYYTIYKPIGQRFGINNNVNINEYIILPAYLNTDPVDIPPPNIYITTLHNDEVLLNYITSYNEEVLNSLKIHVFFMVDIIDKIPPERVSTFIELYYPLLFDKEVVDMNSYNNMHNKLVKMSKKIVDSNLKYEDGINAFINIPNNGVYRPIKSGVTSLRMKCNIYNLKNVSFPLDYIYKSIHASIQFPFIKYCSSPKQEQLIRLHIMENGYPMLKKSDINKIMVTLKKNTGISVYVNMDSTIYKDVVLLFELLENGKINILFDTINTNPFNTQECIPYILNLVNIFSEMINKCLINYNYKLAIYEDITIDNTNIKITNIKYSEIYESESFKQYIPDIKRPIIPAIFYPIIAKKTKESKIPNDIKYYYTRISNFNYEEDEEFNENITTYADISYNINTNMLCVSINNLSSLLYIIVINEYISKYIILMNDKGLQERFKQYGILKYKNTNVDDTLHNEQVNLLNEELERFENADIEENEEEDNEFLAQLLNIQENEGSPDSKESQDLNYDFDTELGDLDTI